MRIQKKGEKGNAANYITRTQATRKLQISLADFRRLCIWKGIYPREPRNKKKIVRGSSSTTTFYYRKDIQYLLHEPLVQKFRDQKVLARKITRALGRGDYADAKRHNDKVSTPAITGKPRYTLNHVVRERYLTFVDALRDLDDCLSMLFLYSNLPSTPHVPAKMVARCERLCLEFQHYLIITHSLRKSFLSVKGVYYQASIQGEDILWLVPYKFKQEPIGDIDFRIMGSFVEFYMTLLGFVNYRLYTSVGLKYPPKFDLNKDENAAELAAFTVEKLNHNAPTGNGSGEEGGNHTNAKLIAPNPQLQEKVDKLIEAMNNEQQEAERRTAAENTGTSMALTTVDRVDDGVQPDDEMAERLDKLEPAVAGGDMLYQPSYSSTNPGTLFSQCTVYLSRETPRAPLEFILRAFGCKQIGWDAVLGGGAFTHDERDPRITHQIVDRPVVRAVVDEQHGDGEDNQTSLKLPGNQRVVGRVYVQPQWVWDSINAEELQDVHKYVPGAELPPHLSPFVKSAPGQYDPTLTLEEQQMAGEDLLSDVSLDPDMEEDEDEDEDDLEDEEDDEEEEEKVENNEAAHERAKPKRVKHHDELDLEHGMDVEIGDDNDEDDDDGDENKLVDNFFGGFDDDEMQVAAGSDEEDEEAGVYQRQRELAAELNGETIKVATTEPKAKAREEAKKKLIAKAKQEREELERRKGMMPNKKRRLYEKMDYGNKRRDAEAEKLRSKRRKIEKQKQTRKS